MMTNNFRLKGFMQEGNTVRYSTEVRVLEDMRGEKEYIPVQTVQEKELSSEKAASLAELTEGKRWAGRIVARDKDWKSERIYSFDYWVLRGDHEMFTAHKVGPNGAGSAFNSAWDEISDIILGE